MIEASVVSGSPVCESPHMKHQEMAVFHRICSSQPGGGGGGVVVVGGLSGAAAALVYSFFCLNWKKKKKKKKGLWRTCKGISKEHIVIPFFVTSLYVSFLIFRCPCWIEQRYWPLSSSVCLRDEGVSCNVDEVIYCNRVNLFVKTDGVISCAAGSLPKIGAKIAQSCFYTTRRGLKIKTKLLSKCYILNLHFYNEERHLSVIYFYFKM